MSMMVFVLFSFFMTPYLALQVRIASANKYLILNLIIRELLSFKLFSYGGHSSPKKKELNIELTYWNS